MLSGTAAVFCHLVLFGQAVAQQITLPFLCGNNEQGALGFTEDVYGSPVQHPLSQPDWSVLGTTPANGISAVATGFLFTLALGGDGHLYSWGLNSNGQLGVGDQTSRDAVAAVTWSNTVPEPSGGIVGIATGDQISLAIGANHVLYVWGLLSYAQPSPLIVTRPVAVAWTAAAAPSGGVRHVSAGTTHVVAVGADTAAYAWGDNTYGAVCDWTNANRAAPVAVVWAPADAAQPAGGVVQAAAGGRHTLLLGADYNVYSCGSNEHGQLGNGLFTAMNHPVEVKWGIFSWPAFPGAVTQVAAGQEHSVALGVDRLVYSWGSDIFGEQGIGAPDFVYAYVYPQQVVWAAAEYPSAGITAVTAGNYFSAATGNSEAGQFLGCWGSNYYGQLAMGTADYEWHMTPTRVDIDVGTMVGTVVSSPRANTFGVVLTTGVALMWGQNDYYNIGDGSTLTRTSPTAVHNPPVGGFSALAVGAYHTLAIQTGGHAVYGWGDNSYGEVGSNIHESQPYPILVPGSGGWGQIVQVYVTDYTSFALNVTGAVRSFGYDGSGTCGDGQQTTFCVAATVVKPMAVFVVSTLAPGSEHVVAVVAGVVWGWGDNGYGQLGDGTYSQSSIPVQPVWGSGAPTVVQVAAGNYHSVALTVDGIIYAWGNNNCGQLGDGTSASDLSPAAVFWPGGAPTVTKIAAGSQSTTAVTASNTLYSWGCGVASPHLSYSATARHPVQFTGLKKGVVVNVTANDRTICALVDYPAGSHLYVWGNNRHGMLCNEGQDPEDYPVEAPWEGSVTGLAMTSPSGQHLGITSLGAAVSESPTPSLSPTESPSPSLFTTCGAGELNLIENGFFVYTPGEESKRRAFEEMFKDSDSELTVEEEEAAHLEQELQEMARASLHGGCVSREDTERLARTAHLLAMGNDFYGYGNFERWHASTNHNNEGYVYWPFYMTEGGMDSCDSYSECSELPTFPTFAEAQPPSPSNAPSETTGPQFPASRNLPPGASYSWVMYQWFAVNDQATMTIELDYFCQSMPAYYSSTTGGSSTSTSTPPPTKRGALAALREAMQRPAEVVAVEEEEVAQVAHDTQQDAQRLVAGQQQPVMAQQVAGQPEQQVVPQQVVAQQEVVEPSERNDAHQSAQDQLQQPTAEATQQPMRQETAPETHDEAAAQDGVWTVLRKTVWGSEKVAGGDARSAVGPHVRGPTGPSDSPSQSRSPSESPSESRSLSSTETPTESASTTNTVTPTRSPSTSSTSFPRPSHAVAMDYNITGNNRCRIDVMQDMPANWFEPVASADVWYNLVDVTPVDGELGTWRQLSVSVPVVPYSEYLIAFRVVSADAPINLGIAGVHACVVSPSESPTPSRSPTESRSPSSTSYPVDLQNQCYRVGAADLGLLKNGGFEMGTLKGWNVTTQRPSYYGSFYITSGGQSPLSFQHIGWVPYGRFYAVSDQRTYGSYVMYQDFTVPATVSRIAIVFSMSCNSRWPASVNNTMNWGGPLQMNQHCRVDLVDPTFTDWFGANVTRGVIQNIVAPFAVYDLQADPLQFYAVDAYVTPGRSYRLAFRNVNNMYFLNHGVDEVAICWYPSPSPPPVGVPTGGIGGGGGSNAPSPSVSASMSGSMSKSLSSSATPSQTSTNTASATQGSSRSITPSQSFSASTTASPSASATPSQTPSSSASSSSSSSATPSSSSSSSQTSSTSVTPSTTTTASVTPSTTGSGSVTISTTPSNTPTISTTRSPTVSPSFSSSTSVSFSSTRTPTSSTTATASASRSASLSGSISFSLSVGNTPSNTASTTRSISLTRFPSSTVTATESLSPSRSFTPSTVASQSPSLTGSTSITATRSPTLSTTGSNTPTISITGSNSRAPLPSKTPSRTSVPLSPSSSAFESAAPSPSAQPSRSASASMSFSSSESFSSSISLSLSFTASVSLTRTATRSTSFSQTVSPSFSVTETPSRFSSRSSTETASATLTSTTTVSASRSAPGSVSTSAVASVSTSAVASVSTSAHATTSAAPSVSTSAVGSVSTSAVGSVSTSAHASLSTSAVPSVSSSAAASMSTSATTSGSAVASGTTTPTTSASAAASPSTTLTTSTTASISVSAAVSATGSDVAAAAATASSSVSGSATASASVAAGSGSVDGATSADSDRGSGVTTSPLSAPAMFGLGFAVVVIAALLCACCIFLFLLWRRRKRKREQEVAPQDNDFSDITSEDLSEPVRVRVIGNTPKSITDDMSNSGGSAGNMSVSTTTAGGSSMSTTAGPASSAYPQSAKSHTSASTKSDGTPGTQTSEHSVAPEVVRSGKGKRISFNRK